MESSSSPATLRRAVARDECRGGGDEWGDNAVQAVYRLYTGCLGVEQLWEAHSGLPLPTPRSRTHPAIQSSPGLLPSRLLISPISARNRGRGLQTLSDQWNLSQLRLEEGPC
jgi:hypothetical protein